MRAAVAAALAAGMSAGPARGAAPDSLSGANPPVSPPPLHRGQSPGTAALKSFALPGWGQAGNGAWLKAGLFAGAYGGLLAWGVSLNQDKQEAEGHLHAAPDSLQGYWETEVERLDDDRNAKYWFAGATLLLSVVDAYVDAHLRGFDERIDAEVGWLPEGGGGWSVALKTKWN